jgi:hypothetical protein
MPTQAAKAKLCAAHDTVVTCIGDLEVDSVLTGVCPMGGETHYYETAGGPAVPVAGVGGVHDPMHGVALAPSTPAVEPEPANEWAPVNEWAASPVVADQDLVDETTAPASADELATGHPPLVPPVA